jgi:hypothetical protein
MVAQRYFRADVATYEAVRQSLNAAWGIPNPGTENCILPADSPSVPRDSEGRACLAVHAEWCEWEAVASVLPGLLSSGQVEEIDRAAYMAAMPAE